MANVLLRIALFYMIIAFYAEVVLTVEMFQGKQPEMRKNVWMLLFAALLWPVVAWNSFKRRS